MGYDKDQPGKGALPREISQNCLEPNGKLFLNYFKLLVEV